MEFGSRPDLLSPVAPDLARQDAISVVKRLRDQAHVAYFAGGCVRDELLGLSPKDFDVATDAPPDRVRQIFSNTQSVGAAFGVILVRLRSSMIEVATFRSDGTYLDGRRPSDVEFTTAEHDAQRRDFTINGLFLDPVDGRVIDYVGGQADLAARKLRAIGDPSQRFNEDHLRLLRAIRFASRFDLTIEPRTAEQIRTHAPRLRRISPERIAEELRRMLTPPASRHRAWTLLWEFALVDEILRFLPGVAEAVDFDPVRSPFLHLAPGEPVPFGLALAAGVLCFRTQATQFSTDVRTFLSRAHVQTAHHALRQALRISNDESDVFQGTLQGVGMLSTDSVPTLAMKKRFLATPTWGESLLLMESLHNAGLIDDRVLRLRPELSAMLEQDYAPVPLVTGDDLTALGLRPGPIFREILHSLYDEQLEGQLTSREQAIDRAKSLGAKPTRTTS